MLSDQMFGDRRITLVLHPLQPIEAKITPLTIELADEKVMGAWWQEECLKPTFRSEPIDRRWDWNQLEIEYEGELVPSRKVAAVTGEGEELAVQGAMMISTEPVTSLHDPAGQCLLVELLFTAPRNRPELRRDEQPYVIGVGTQLLIWGAWLSREKGFGGRLRLDASPDFIRWYEKRGLQRVCLEPILYEGVGYTPMELSAGAAQGLLSIWEE